MIRIFGVLFFFLFLPFLLLAFALKSWVLLIVGSLVASAGIVCFSFYSWRLVFRRWSPNPVESRIEARLKQLFAASGPARMKASFFSFRSPVPEVRVWVQRPSSIQFIMSIGFLESVTDQKLLQLFQDLHPDKVRMIRAENNLKALELVFGNWKGRTDRFRYWFVSFWLFPIERLLQLARI
jgi:hypothetical protein